MKIRLNAIKEKKPHLLADELEFHLIFNEDSNELSRSDIYELITEIEYESESTEYEKLVDNDEIDSDEENYSKVDEKIQNRIEGVFIHFHNRQEWFNDFYPYNVKNNYICIQNHEALTDKQKFYLDLLIRSRLSNFDKKSQDKLAKSFEEICAQALRKWIPSLEVRIFGKDSEDRKSYFGNNLRNALKKLAKDCNGYATELIDKKDPKGEFKLTTGDLGLDLIGYQPFIDEAQGKIIIAGQCAAGKETWKGKTMESNYSKFSEYINLSCPWVNMVFIAVCYRDDNKDWCQNRYAAGCILVDRLRLCQMMNGSSSFQNLTSIEEVTLL